MTFVTVVLLLFLTFYSHLSSSLKCYECSGYVPCGNGQTHLLVNCGGKCMVYRNQHDSGMIVRRCCWSNCGSPGTSMHEGRYTYFCTDDMCNGDTADINLLEGEIEGGSGDELETTTAISLSTTSLSSRTTTLFPSTTTLSPRTTTLSVRTTAVSISTGSSSLRCHDCTGHYSTCGTSQHTILNNCRMCMVYRNVYDGNTIVRRCCHSGCGAANSVGLYEGRQTYFCSSNLCNGIGAENALIDTKRRFIAGDSFPNN